MRARVGTLVTLVVALSCGQPAGSPLAPEDPLDDPWLAGPLSPAAAVECGDGVDNDLDGLVDMADSGCASANDPDEFPDNLGCPRVPFCAPLPPDCTNPVQTFFEFGDRLCEGCTICNFSPPPFTCANAETSPGVRRASALGVHVLVGTEGNDTIVGTDGPDLVLGLGGNDRICLRGSLDTAYGGTGDDEIHGGPERDLLLGGPDSDRLFGDEGADHLDGGTGSDACTGGPGRDRLSRCENGQD